MFPSRASAPARRVVQVALQSGVSNKLQRVISHHHQQAEQRRQYVGPAPSVSQRNRARASQGDRLLFDSINLPPFDFWKDLATRGFGDLTAEERLAVARQYCSVATPNGSAWKQALQRDHNIDPYALYCTAAPLMGVPSQKLSFVGFHMLMTASSLGYAPATLSLMAVLARAPDDMFSRWKPQLRDVEARFKRLLQTEKTPDALTLQGLLYLRERQSDAHALRYFDHAIQAARRMSPHNPDHPHQHSPPTTHQPAGPSTRPPRWTYEGSCYLERGHILLRQGQTDEATASFRVAALELDLADGYAELAKLLPPGAPTRETYLLKAAQAGNLEACRLLALDAADKAADPARGRAERAEAATLAREWALVEPDVGRREALLAQVAERVGDATEEQRRRRSDLWKWMMSKLRP